MDCIPKYIVNDFKAKLKNGEITPEKLLNMTSQERHDYFKDVFGMNNASKINSLFESKMLLKSQQQGIIKWAKEIITDKQAQKDIISRVNKMQSLLTPDKEEAFLQDLVGHKLGTTVSMSEAANLSSMAMDANQKKEAIKETSTIGSKERLSYGMAKVEFEDYFNGLKDRAKSKGLREWIMPRNWGEAITNFSGFMKSLKASLDNSVIGRQGLNTLVNDPDIWLKNSVQSFKDFYTSAKGGDALKVTRADIASRPNALNGLYRKQKLAVGVTEESYPTSLPEKIPLIGKLFKGSQDAFTGWQYRTRADVFDRLADVIQKSDGDIEGLGKFVNSFTGRGDMGKLEPASDTLNKLFFAPRFLKANIDSLTGYIFNKNMSSQVRKMAAIASLKRLGATAITLGLVDIIGRAFGHDDIIEWDPRSSSFGTIKIGNTRFDITGGMKSIVTLAARLLTLSSKSSSTGIVSKLNDPRFGAKKAGDVLVDFANGKLSPGARLALNLLNNEDFKGREMTAGGIALEVFEPIPISNARELMDDPNSAPIILALISDALGVGTNTYGIEKDWEVKTTEKMKAFKEKVGAKKFKRANDKFNKEYNEWFDKTKLSQRFHSLSDDDKRKVLSKKSSELKDKILSSYGFFYKSDKKPLPKF